LLKRIPFKIEGYHFGFKLHNKIDVEYGLIRSIKTTTASVHDSQVDLSVKVNESIETKDILALQPKADL
jgi:IS5 family transposase